jgi:twitching motility two-component system response regulator PilG
MRIKLSSQDTPMVKTSQCVNHICSIQIVMYSLDSSTGKEEKIRTHRWKERSTMAQLILIIDDSETVRKILEVTLRRAGYEDVRAFPDGIELFRWLTTPQARIPALVIVDLTMPKMDGYDLIRRLKAKPAFARTIFVILSGRVGVLDKLKGRLCGAHTYLTKPFTTQGIVAVVESYLGAAAPPIFSVYEERLG